MDSSFGKTFIFLSDLAYKSRFTLPMLVTAAFMIMDIRLQIEINFRREQRGGDDNFDDYSDITDESLETTDGETDSND